jgi:hypothetical protein
MRSLISDQKKRRYVEEGAADRRGEELELDMVWELMDELSGGV